MRRLVVVLLAVALLALPGTPPPASAAPEKWTTRVFAKVPSPGRPAYVHVHTNGRVYAANYEAGDTQRSRVFEYGSGVRCCAPGRCPASGATSRTASRWPPRPATAGWCCSRPPPAASSP